MGTTPKGISYPDLTAFVKDGASAMQGLAEDVDERLGGSRAFADVTNQSIPGGAETGLGPLVFNGSSSPEWDITEIGFSLTYTGPDVTVVVTAQVVWAANANGYRRTVIRLNDDNTAFSVKATADADGSQTTHQVVTAILSLTSGDRLGVRVEQSSGGALDVNNGKLRAVVVGFGG